MAGEFLYPTINEDLFIKCGLNLQASFMFNKGTNVLPLDLEALTAPTNQTLYRFSDDTSTWDYRFDPAWGSFTIKIDKPTILFGENGVAASDAVLGVGIEWKASESKVRGYQFLGYIKNSNDAIILPEKKCLVKDWTTNVSFRLVIFVAKPGSLMLGDYFGNEEGLVLGKRDEFTIIVKGNGSAFPLINRFDSNGPLWWVEVDSNADPSCDSFNEDNVAIIFNASNSLFKYIDIESADYNFHFMKEVFAAALSALILEIRKILYQDHFNVDGPTEPGTIDTAIKYFKKSLNIDVDGSPAELSKSVVRYVEKEFKK